MSKRFLKAKNGQTIKLRNLPDSSVGCSKHPENANISISLSIKPTALKYHTRKQSDVGKAKGAKKHKDARLRSDLSLDHQVTPEFRKHREHERVRWVREEPSDYRLISFANHI
jgi:hypothetical protein